MKDRGLCPDCGEPLYLPHGHNPCGKGRWEIEDGIAYWIENGVCWSMMPASSLTAAVIGLSKKAEKEKK